MGEKIDAQAEIIILSDKLKVIVAMMTEITLRLGQIQQSELETEARVIRDRVSSLSGQLNTTTIDPKG